jgi:hypothetical protein
MSQNALQCMENRTLKADLPPTRILFQRLFALSVIFPVFPERCGSSELGRDLRQRSRTGVLFLYVVLCQSLVPFRHIQVRVSHYPLEGKDVAAVSKEVQGKAVPQIVRPYLHTQLLRVTLPELFRPGFTVHHPSFPVGKDGNLSVPFRWTGFQQFPDGFCRDIGQRKVREMRVLAFSARMVISLPR